MTAAEATSRLISTGRCEFNLRETMAHPNWSTRSFARLLAPGPFLDFVFLTPPPTVM